MGGGIKADGKMVDNLKKLLFHLGCQEQLDEDEEHDLIVAKPEFQKLKTEPTFNFTVQKRYSDSCKYILHDTRYL